ncbi:MAG: 2-thiouracil desulfurase family protein [Crocinitomicaceae bacterium]
MTNTTYLNNLRIPTKENPLRILMSACLAGITCGYDGSANGEYPSALKFLTYDTVKIVKFCPEEFSFGTPREMCDIHGGTGTDVLNGKAKVLSESGKDWTDGMIKASEKMLEIAKKENIEIAILMDISAACGSQVIYGGNRFGENKVYQIGSGVSAAQLKKNGFEVISQRDFASLEILYAKIDPQHKRDETKVDHHEIEWYKNYFNR